MVKNVNTYMYSIEVRYLKLVSTYIANSLHARVYWPFAVGASFADLELLLKLSPHAMDATC